MKKVNIFIIIFVFFNINLLGQSIYDYVNATVLIKIPKGSATGFFIIREKSGDIYLVTNKHVIENISPNDFIGIRINITDNDQSTIKYFDVRNRNTDLYKQIKFHPKNKCDIAAIKIPDNIVKLLNGKHFIPYRDLLSNEALNTLNSNLNAIHIEIGDEIFIIGYPESIYDEKNDSPILLQGILSTSPDEYFIFRHDYTTNKLQIIPDTLDGFLIDGNTLPGSSGSLVINKPKPDYIAVNKLILANPTTPYLLGIYASSFSEIVEDTVSKVFNENKPDSNHQKSNIIVINKTRIRSGIGIVFSAETIIETIEQFYKK